MALRGRLAAAVAELEQLTGGPPEAVLGIDLAATRRSVGGLLQEASALVRSTAAGPAVDLRGADLFGVDLRRRDLRAADLRGALLVGADLRGVDLRVASLLGADLRGTDLRGADLREVLYLTQAQLQAARGDTATRLTRPLVHPAHW